LDHSTRTVLVQIQGVKRTFILDSGSCRSILQPGVSDETTGCTDFAPFGEWIKIRFIGVKETTNKLGGIEKSSSENQFRSFGVVSNFPRKLLWLTADPGQFLTDPIVTVNQDALV